VLFTFVYVFGVGITAIVAKIAGKRFLDYSLNKKSYWTKVDSRKKTMEDYYRQF
jgi:hypothetical protein